MSAKKQILFLFALLSCINVFAQVNIYVGGSGDGGSGNVNTTYLGSCPWTAAPPAYSNIYSGGSADGHSMNANTTYLAACPWNNPASPYTNIAQGGNADGHSMNVNTTYLGSCVWNAAPPAYSNIAQGGNADGNKADSIRCQNYVPFCGVIANAGRDTFICSAAPYSSVQLNATGGTIYSWTPATGLNNPNISNPVATPAVTTTYIVNVGDGVCSKNDTVIVTVNPVPAANTGSNQTICLGDSAQLGAAPVGGNTYSWTPTNALSSAVIANPKAAPVSTTTYTLTEIVTATACQKSNSVTITLSIPAAAVGPNRTICYGQSTTIGAAAVGGSTYDWTPTTGLSSSTAANPTANPTTTTVYTLTETITATGCARSNSVTVTVNPLPNANAGSNQTICLGDSAQLGAAAVGGDTYSWLPTTALSSATVANPKASPASTTTYTLTETITATGCQKSNSVIVTVNPLPTAATGGDKTICSGVSITIGDAAVGGNTYSWLPTSNLSDPTASNPTANPTSTTTYTLTEIITATGCQKSNAMILTVNLLPAANTGSNQQICNGGSVTIGAAAVGGNTYSWSPTSGLSSSTVSNPTANPASTTTYTLTETITATTCQKSNSVVVTVVPPASISATLSTICIGQSPVLTAIGGYAGGQSYLWTPGGETASSITVSPAVTTTYGVTITDAYCSTTASQTVTVVGSCAPVNFYVGGNADGHSMSVNTSYLGSCPWTPAAVSYSNVALGGNADGHSMNMNVSYLGTCSWNAPPPAYTNIMSGGNADGYAMNDNTSYLVPCPWVAAPPTYSIIARGGASDGYSQFDPNGCFAYTPLPIELIFFTATLQENTKVLCEWVTATEINNDYFTVEKTNDRATYELVAVVKGPGNSNKTLYYSATDELPYMETSYYRLKQTDYDGKYQYSKLVPITIHPNGISIKTYPNPASDLFSIFANTNKSFEMTVSIHDMLGRNVFQKIVSVQKGNNELTMDISKFNDGVYFITIQNNNDSETLTKTRLVKIKNE